VAQRVQPSELRSRPVGDEPFEAASYDLVFEAVEPVFNMHQSDLGSEKVHLEHGGTFKGRFVIEGKSIDVNARGYRDHSVSRRTFTTLDTETWAHCTFPGGKVFSMLEVSRGDKYFVKSQVYVDGEMHLAEPLLVPDLLDSSGNPHSGRIDLQVESEIIEIQWETAQPHFIPFQLLRPVGMRPGVDLSDPENMVAVQCPAVRRQSICHDRAGPGAAGQPGERHRAPGQMGRPFEIADRDYAAATPAIRRIVRSAQ
jgi:hypothetical protein